MLSSASLVYIYIGKTIIMQRLVVFKDIEEVNIIFKKV